jgi:hypothetical protein
MLHMPLVDSRLALAAIEPWLPTPFGGGDGIPDGIVGAVIVAFGSIGDGLAIDYRLPTGEACRVVLSVTDHGMGIRYESPVARRTSSTPA